MKEKVRLINKTIMYIPTLTLSCSIYNYRPVILKPTIDNILIFLTQAFEEISGVSKKLIIDNHKTFLDSKEIQPMIKRY